MRNFRNYIFIKSESSVQAFGYVKRMLTQPFINNAFISTTEYSRRCFKWPRDGFYEYTLRTVGHFCIIVAIYLDASGQYMFEMMVLGDECHVIYDRDFTYDELIDEVWKKFPGVKCIL